MNPKALFCITDGQGILKITQFHWEAKDILASFGNLNLSIIRYNLQENTDVTDVEIKEVNQEVNPSVNTSTQGEH